MKKSSHQPNSGNIDVIHTGECHTVNPFDGNNEDFGNLELTRDKSTDPHSEECTDLNHALSKIACEVVHSVLQDDEEQVPDIGNKVPNSRSDSKNVNRLELIHGNIVEGRVYDVSNQLQNVPKSLLNHQDLPSRPVEPVSNNEAVLINRRSNKTDQKQKRGPEQRNSLRK